MNINLSYQQLSYLRLVLNEHFQTLKINGQMYDFVKDALIKLDEALVSNIIEKVPCLES